MGKTRILVKNVGERLVIREVENLVGEYQKIVGGYIETVSISIGNEIILVVNEEGKLNGSKPNFSLRGCDVIFGDCFFVGEGINEDGENDFISLTDEQIFIIRGH